MEKTNPDLKFSQKHPLAFGFLLIAAAMILIIGAMAAFTFFMGNGKARTFFAKNKVGVVYVHGEIVASRSLAKWIDRLSEDEEIKGVVLRINSPGGGVAASQEIFAAVERLAASKYVVASMSSMATSGGYYVACGADKIMANPGTITASIGVKAKMTNVQGLMDKLGIKEQTVDSGKYKNAGSMFKPLTPDERAYFQELVDNLHAQFVEDVAASRAMSVEAVNELADGRAMTGEQAWEAGLVDTLGGFDAAIESVCSEAGYKGKCTLVEGPQTKEPLLKKFLGHFFSPDQVLSPHWLFYYE
ncbi:MAG: signal peptide peptidase SppA [Thermodesulfobacteriota bacterium]